MLIWLLSMALPSQCRYVCALCVQIRPRARNFDQDSKKTSSFLLANKVKIKVGLDVISDTDPELKSILIIII